MSTDIRMFCSILLMASLCGCAASPTRMTQTYDHIEVQLSSADRGRYYFVSTQGRTYGLTTGASGKVTFRIPSDAPLQGCYTILNEKGKYLLKNPVWFYPSVRQTYLAAADQRNNAQRKVAANEQAQRDSLSRLNQARAELVNNAAWKGTYCEAPLRATIPPRPPAPCSSREECTAQAHRGCSMEFLTKQFCGLLLSKAPIPGLSIVACNTVVEHFSREEYGAEGQFNNTMAFALGGALLAAIAQSQDNSAKSESISALEMVKLILEIANAVNEYNDIKACTDNIVERQYGPLDRWMNEYGAAQAESERQLQSCTDDQLAIQEESARLSDATADAPRLEFARAQLDLQVKHLEIQQEPLTFCTVRSAPVRRIPRRTYAR